MGDGVITPSMSILSAVEGSAFIPGVSVSQGMIILGAMVITIFLFIF
jgi:KUP system potassium uptake protein